MSADADPLDGAAIGETREFGGVAEIYAMDLVDWSWQGTDRETTVDVTDVELIETDDGETVVAIHYDGEATQLLPRRWDECEAPRTDAERRGARRRRWLRRGARAVPLAIGVAVATSVLAAVFPAISRVSMRLSETTTAPTVLDVLPGVALIFSLAAVLVWGLSGGLPGGFYGGLRP